MTLTAQFLDEIRSRTSLLSVVSRRVKLIKTGAEHSGLCPFHNEKSPSFTVSDSKDFFHCFGCGAHGDVIAFVMRSENRTFMETVEILAEDAGMAMPKTEPQDPAVAAKRSSLMEINERAAAWYEAQLALPHGQAARDYLVERGITLETAAKFRLGWAPTGADVLRRALLNEGFAESLMFEAGLIRKRQTGEVVDLLRRRLVFPIFDGRGKVIAFGGRILEVQGKAPKYLNSPATPLFDKSTTLYGLPFAREGAGASGTVIAVEGYLDVIATHQAGFNMTVAPLGTALGDGHLDLLWKMASTPIICLDGDAAGAKAMLRVADVALPLLTKGRGLKFATLPNKDDPDSLIKRDGARAFGDVIETAQPLSDVVWSAAKSAIPPDNPEQLAAFEQRLYDAGSLIPDSLIRSRMLGHWRALIRTGFDDPPDIFIGRSTKITAPHPGSKRLDDEWERGLALAEKSPVPGWLQKQGVAWDALVRVLGGVGLVRGRVTKGRYHDLTPDIRKMALWDFEGETSLVMIPEWEGEPGASALLDLVCFDPRVDGEGISTRTGSVPVLGTQTLLEARGFETRALAHPVFVAETPLSWLRHKIDGRAAVLVVDWSRAWDALGGLSQIIAETEDLAEKLDRMLTPPQRRRPKILMEETPHE